MSERKGSECSFWEVRFSRRQVLKGAAAGALTLTLPFTTSFALHPEEPKPLVRPERLGLTISRVQSEYYAKKFPGFSHEQFLRESLDLNLDVYRLCNYWDRIERRMGVYDFSELERELEIVRKHNEQSEKPVEIVVTQGVFSPSQPEVFIPGYVYREAGGREKILSPDRALDENEFLAKRNLLFIKESVRFLRDYPFVKFLQVENESRNALPTADRLYISQDHLKKEVNAARQEMRDDQDILITNAVYALPYVNDDVEIFKDSLMIGDVAGVNVYDYMPILFIGYVSLSPFYLEKVKANQLYALSLNKQAWVTELQAEPWELDPEIKFLEAITQSASPEKTAKLLDQVTRSGYQTAIFWGGAHWYYWKLQGDERWWSGAKKMAAAPKFSLAV